MIRNVLMDLDETLFDFLKGERAALAGALMSYGYSPDEQVLDLYHEINDRHWKMLERGEITKQELNPMRFRCFSEMTGMDLPAETVCVQYEKNLSEKFCFIPGAEETLKQLSEKYRVYASSNGYTATQVKRIRLSGIEKYFSDIFISEAIGYEKPAEEFFRVCFERIPGFVPDETVIVGDSLTSDIAGGRNAGIRTVWFNYRKKESGAVAPDYTVYSLDELCPLLETIQ